MRNAIFMVSIISLLGGCDESYTTEAAQIPDGETSGAASANGQSVTPTQTTTPAQPAPVTPDNPTDPVDDTDVRVVAGDIPITLDDPAGPYCDCPSTHPGAQNEQFDSIRLNPVEVPSGTTTINN